MAALSIISVVPFFGKSWKSLTRGENHYKRNPWTVLRIRGEIHASMKSKVYNVMVGNARE